MLTYEQILDRKHGIGGSDAAAACGMSQYRTRYDLWAEKLGIKEKDDFSEQQKLAIDIGHSFESPLASLFEKEYELLTEIIDYPIQHEKYPWLRGNIDRKIIGKEEGLEIKTSGLVGGNYYFMSKNWGAENSDYIPDDYLYQCMHYMAITGWNRWHLYALVGGKGLVKYTIERDNDFIDGMIKLENEFWNMVVTKNPPQPQNLQDCSNMWPKSDDIASEATLDVYGAYQKLTEIQNNMKALESQSELLKLQLQNHMKDSSELKFQGRILATWKTNNQNSFDQKSFRESNPELFNNFYKSKEIRRFLIK